MKKIILRVGVAALLVAGGVWVGTGMNPVEADTNSAVPGSADDPVVTKSYVDEQIAKAGGGSGSSGGSQQPETGGASAKLEVVSVPAGKTLIANEGTEVVVRAGKAIVYTTDSNGIADLTDGKDLTNGKAIPANHHMLFPRAGRGVTTAAGYTKSLTLLVRGSYVIQ